MGDAVPRWKRYFHDVIAAEISPMTRYFDRVIQIARLNGDSGYLLERLDCPEREHVAGAEELDLSGETNRRTAILLNGTLNHHYDIEGFLREMKPRLSRLSRVIVVAYNPYLQWLYRLAMRLHWKAGDEPTTFITHTDLDNICRLAAFERVRVRPAAYVPFRLLGFGSLVNRLMPLMPLLRHTALTSIIVLRPIVHDSAPPQRLSIVIPARNERGNLAAALERLPDLGMEKEVIFVEGHSTDGTWEEIQRLAAANPGVVALQQSGKGKADAVRLGFAHATGDLLTIVDADLTMPPELLPRFVDAYRRGVADFVNGSRIVYPMEGGAMRFLNRLGNVFFAKALSWVLGGRMGDCLCGTKLMRRDDYERMIAWRRDFGDFDPFGDFELLFPAATLGIGMVDVPIRYRTRTYGTTNISRFTHGLMLLRMTFVGLFRIRLGRIPHRHGH
jgi:hypothetical protein